MEVDLEEFQNQVSNFQKSLEAGKLSAAARYDKFHSYDPFEEIPATLLTAGHLASYALACGMIEPFEPDKLIKPATYLVKVEGDCRFIDETGKLVSFYLSSEPEAWKTHLDVRNRIRLAPNSVCFVTLAPEFRLPAYLAARFNLLIRDVYRGLLVGTGPLVDPGFTGRLSIPIHNFTDREYFVSAGEGLVYFEFTKMSWTNPQPVREKPPWLPSPIEVQPPFPKSKTGRKNLDNYLADATGGGPPASSIGLTLNRMTKQVGKAKLMLNLFTIAGFAAIAALVFTSWSLYSGAQQFTAAAQTEMRQAREKMDERMKSLERRLEAAEAREPSPPHRSVTPPNGEPLRPPSRGDAGGR